MKALTAWQRWARHRSRKHGVPHEDVTRAEVLALTGGRCYMCGVDITSETAEIDHVWPVSKGGPSVLGNLRGACPTCNGRKSDRITVMPASELGRAVAWTYAVAHRLARIGVRAAPLYPSPGAFGPHVVTLRLWPAPGHVQTLLRAAPEIEAVLGECRAGVPSIRFEAPYLCIEVPRMRPQPVALSAMQSSGLRVQVGVDTRGRPAVVDLAESPHVIIGGASGGGKSVLLQTLAYGLACGGARLALADGDASTFDAMRPWAALQYAVADTARDAIALACEVQAEIDRRKGWWDTPLVLIVDEAQLIATDRKGKAALADIAARGRKRGVSLCLATQYIRADIIDPRITGQCGHRIALRLETDVAARMIGCPGATRLAGRGDALISSGGKMVRAQIAMGCGADFDRMPRADGQHAPVTTPQAATIADDIAAWAAAQPGRVSARAIRLKSRELAPDGVGIGSEKATRIREMVRAGGMA